MNNKQEDEKTSADNDTYSEKDVKENNLAAKEQAQTFDVQPQKGSSGNEEKDITD